MSFTFNWPRFSDQFHYDAIHMLNNALNKGNKPPIIADKIEVVELEMGTEPPELEIREIGELTVDQFRGIFRLSYAGDAHLVLKTKVQANPLNHKQPDIHIMTGSKGMLAAKQPLVVPMLLRLSHFKLRSIVVLVVSKQKGITLVFKTDPLQNVDINSTFDSIAVIQNFIQREIEGQLRQMFREDLPGIIHRLSQQWIKAKVEAPYLARPPPMPARHSTPNLSQSAPDLTFMNVAQVPSMPSLLRSSGPTSGPTSRPTSLRRAASSSGASVASTSRRKLSTPSPPAHDTNSSLSDLETFDPTYGLRPEGLPIKSVFKGFGNLFTANKGLADLMEEEETSEFDDESTTYDMVDWDDGVPSIAAPPLSDRAAEYETIPAVGGGVITRPRVYHSQSMIQPSPDPSPPLRRPRPRSFDNLSGLATPMFSGLNTPGFTTRSLYTSYFPDFATIGSNDSSSKTPQTAPPFFSTHTRPMTPDSLGTTPSQSSGDLTSPHSNDSLNSITDIQLPPPPLYSERRLSVSSSPSNLDYSPFASPPSPTSLDHDPKIVLRPNTLNTTLHQLSTLSQSNHTLSPYTRSLSHFTVRSVPPRYAAGPSQAADRQPVKAKRKRLYRMGGRTQTQQPLDEPTPANASHTTSQDFDPSSENTPHGTSGTQHGSNHDHAPSPDLELDLSDMDRYFPSYDPDQQKTRPLHQPPRPILNHVRLRQSYTHPEYNNSQAG